MAQLRDSHPAVAVRPAFFVIAAIALLSIPIKWIVAWLMAVFWHELFHYFAIRIQDYRVMKIDIGAGGVTLETEHMLPGQAILATMAGPMASGMLMFCCRWFPRLAICGFFQCVFNLLPLYPLDGGRALKNLVTLVFSEETAENVMQVLEKAFICLCATVSVAAYIFHSSGPIPILLTLLLWMKIKIPCKDGRLRVQ